MISRVNERAKYSHEVHVVATALDSPGSVAFVMGVAPVVGVVMGPPVLNSASVVLGS